MSNFKTYRRSLGGMNSIQKLITLDGNFHRIENVSLGAHITKGFTPNEFFVGNKVPYGFYSKLGFKQYKEGGMEAEFQDYSAGDYTQSF